MKINGNEEKVYSLSLRAEKVGKIINDSILSGSKTIRTNVLETTEDEKDTFEGAVKDTANIVIETVENIHGAVVETLLQSSKIIREHIFDTKTVA